jgi:hypothetical protein
MPLPPELLPFQKNDIQAKDRTLGTGGTEIGKTVDTAEKVPPAGAVLSSLQTRKLSP